MIRPIVISSVMPEKKAAGQLTLYRHLVEDPEIEPTLYGDLTRGNTTGSFLRKVAGKLVKHPPARETLWHIWKGRWIDGCLPREVPNREEVVVLTVAHGDLFPAAQRFAKRHRLPLVSIFHDWWPDLPEHYAWIHRSLERSFMGLHRASQVSLCVSENMVARLGPHSEARVLYPIPSWNGQMNDPGGSQEPPGEPLRLRYFGNLGDYGGIVRQAIDSLHGQPGIKLEVRGYGYSWPEDYTQKLKKMGVLLDFAPAPEFDAWLNSSDVFLITSSFAKQDRLRMETSFPSKLVEATRYGRPLLIWAPADSAAARWGMDGDKALVVTEENPEHLARAIDRLRNENGLFRHYSQRASAAAMGEFNPRVLQEQFRTALKDAIRMGPKI